MPKQSLLARAKLTAQNIANYVLSKGKDSEDGGLRGKTVKTKFQDGREVQASVFGKFREGEEITPESTSEQAPELSILVRPDERNKLIGLLTIDYDIDGRINVLKIQESNLLFEVPVGVGNNKKNAQTRYKLVLEKTYDALTRRQ